MNPLNLSLYRPSEMELWIKKKYIENNILTPSDMDLERIAKSFNAYVAYTDSGTKVIYDDHDCIIFLNSLHPVDEMRLAFFHELCHPALHVGNQNNLPPAFVNLQESQATQFQLYAAMPAFMLNSFPVTFHWNEYYAHLSEAFMLPIGFIECRIKQIKARIDQEEWDIDFKARLTPKKTKRNYSKETLRILNQLHRQLKKRQDTAFD